MREIKFRGWTIQEGDKKIGHLTADDHGNPRIQDKDGWIDYIVPETVGQYTGAKANFNEQIYEGDILSIFDSSNEKSIQAVVVFSFGCFSVCKNGHPKNGTQTLLSLHCEEKTITIIGNIHEHPNLLANGK